MGPGPGAPFGGKGAQSTPLARSCPSAEEKTRCVFRLGAKEAMQVRSQLTN